MSATALLLSIPVVTAAIGWITNVVAVRMLYGPERFVGIGPLGWQGVVFRYHERFAGGYAGVVVDHLVSARDLVEQLSTEDLDALFEELVSPEGAVPFVERFLELVRPGLWRSFSPKLRESIVEQVRNEAKRAVREIHERAGAEAESLLDLRAFLQSVLLADGGRTMSAISQEVGRRELRFIELFGGVFGFVVGIAEVAAGIGFDAWWILPLVGGLVGAGTNWIALRMVFRPLEPRCFLGMVPYQGLFPRRQREFAREFSRVLARDVLTLPHLLDWLSRGQSGLRPRATARALRCAVDGS